MTSVLADRHAREAYDSFAPYYDAFTASHDYEGWTRTIERLAVHHGLSGRRLLDAGCGTGKSFMPFLGRGYDVVACDISPGMLERARAKAPDVELHVRDLRHLGVLGAFDLVACLDDALNYLLTPDELRMALRGLARNLAPGGVLVFDLNTLSTYRSFFASTTSVDAPDRLLVWRGQGPADLASGARSTARLDAFDRRGDGPWTHTWAVHHQRHHPRDEVERLLSEAGLTCAGVYGMHMSGRTEPGSDEARHTKTLYLARHKACA